jgi:hypothetical protein
MKNWSKLVLPIGLGIVAGVMHYRVLVPKLTPHAYVQVNRDLNPGDRLGDDCLTPIEMPGEFTRLAKTLVPWEHRKVLAGCHVTRELHKGDVVFYSDTSDYVLSIRPNEVAHAVELSQGMVTPGSFQVGAALRFRMSRTDRSKAEKDDADDKPRMRWDAATKSWVSVRPSQERTLGPLRILALGADTIHDGRVSTENTYNPCNVTLAFPRDPDSGELVAWAERLLDALAEKSDESVVGVEVCEPADAAAPESPAGLASAR